ncbi:MAG: ZIP family metal transporter [bacterium]|nr:ZIP family metal transporter [bacterium]
MLSDSWTRFTKLGPVHQALLGTLFTWGLTAAGASLVFFLRRENKRLLDIMLGFTGGVMIAASFWSLLSPAIEMSANLEKLSWLPAAVGFSLGAVFLRLADFITPHLHLKAPIEEAEGIPTKLERTTLLVLAITLHNIPEGLAVGVAFGAAAHGLESATVASAVVLAFGIGIQNFPEGMAVSMPMRREGFSPAKSFWSPPDWFSKPCFPVAVELRLNRLLAAGAASPGAKRGSLRGAHERPVTESGRSGRPPLLTDRAAPSPSHRPAG